MHLNYRSVLSVIKRKAPSGFSSFVKNTIRNSYQIHKPSEKGNILLFTSRRSGGTWLTEMISSCQGIQSVIEPHETGKKDNFFLKRGVYPDSILKRGGIPRMRIDDGWVKKFHEDIITGREKIQYAWNPWHPGFWKRSDRLCIKMHVMKPWINWFSVNFPEDKICILLRHPVPQALSAKKLDSKFLTPLYLADEVFVDEHLNREQLECAKNIIQTGDVFAQYMLDWCVKNLVPLRSYTKHPEWTLITYEDLVLNNSDTLDLLSDRFNLCKDSMLSRAAIPSATIRSSNTESALSNKDAEKRNHYLLSRWTKSVGKEDKYIADKILDTFDIQMYSTDSSLPHIR